MTMKKVAYEKIAFIIWQVELWKWGPLGSMNRQHEWNEVHAAVSVEQVIFLTRREMVWWSSVGCWTKELPNWTNFLVQWSAVHFFSSSILGGVNERVRLWHASNVLLATTFDPPMSWVYWLSNSHLTPKRISLRIFLLTLPINRLLKNRGLWKTFFWGLFSRIS